MHIYAARFTLLILLLSMLFAFSVSIQAEDKKDPVLHKLPAVPAMVKIPKGSFTMGSAFGVEDQLPVHEVEVPYNFAISKYEIAFSQYDRFAVETGRGLPDDNGWGRGNRPVINVSWYDAVAYTKWLSEKTGRKFRLPTEAEWEYVARTGRELKLGHKRLGLGDANCDDCRWFWEEDATKPVGQYRPNLYGVYDLFGNVWEWTCSNYTKRYNGNELNCLSEREAEGHTIAVRGGDYDTAAGILFPYVRYNNFPTYRGKGQGFRVVMELGR